MSIAPLIEIKYKVPKYLTRELYAYLRRYASVPKKFSKGTVSTTYFDDNAQTCLYDTLDGQLDRLKYRLREYSDTSPGAAKYSLEIKRRINQRVEKIRTFIYANFDPSYNITNFSALISYIESLTGLKLNAYRINNPDASTLYPDILLKYKRHRFDDKHYNARYNLDMNLKVGFPHGIRTTRYLANINYDIFEIKKNTYDERVNPIINRFNLETLTISKYIKGKQIC